MIESESRAVGRILNLWLSLGALAIYIVLIFLPTTGKMIGFYIFIYIILGWKVLSQSVIAVLKRNFFNENTLMTIATLGAFFLQEYKEAVGVMLFYRIGEYLQDRAVETSKKHIHDLFKLENFGALVLSNGVWEQKDPKNIQIGEIILVKKGDKVPLDGVVYQGTSFLDTSSLTGESLPISVKEGDSVLSGMVNEAHSIEIQVTKIYEDSSIQRLIRLIEKASERKAPIEKFMTRFAHRYTPIVFGLAFLFFFVPVVFFNANWHIWLERSIVLLVISCPCALVLSPPLSFFSGLGVCSKNGILVKSGEYLQILTQIKNIALDKTGTITHGNLAVQEFWVLKENEKEDCFRYLALMESVSSHPIARAIILNYTENHNLAPKADFPIQEIPGKGLVANVDGKEILVGSENFLLEKNISLEARPSSLPIGTWVHLSVDEVLKAVAVISDSLKPNSIDILEQLQQKFTLVILSGDNRAVVADVAGKVGITEFYPELLPENKVEWIEKIRQRGTTMFVGDGLNDAPSLETADIGVAMGQKGADISIEAADIVITEDDLGKIPLMIRIAQKTLYITKENIIWALIVKILIMFLALFSLAGIWAGVFADVGVSLLAILNCLRIFQNPNK